MTVNGSSDRTPINSRSEVRDVVRGLWSVALGLDDEWPDDATFLELGGYSLLALSLADQIASALSTEVPRTIVLEQQTLSSVVEWIHRFTTVGLGGPAQFEPPESGTGVVRDATLSPLQQAYVLGETGKFDLARPAVFVEEYAVDDIAVDQLEEAVLVLIARHEILRSVFTDEGTYYPLPTPMTSPITYIDLRDLPEDQVADRLSESFASLSEHVPPFQSGEVIRMMVHQLETSFRLQVCGRLIAFDGRSGEIFADELRDYLETGVVSPAPGLKFSDYRHAVTVAEVTKREASRLYWESRIAELPPAPELPQRLGPEILVPTMTRRSLTLDEESWAAIHKAAVSRGITSTAALCAAFCEVLRQFSVNPDFTLNVMYGARRPVHPDVENLLGNCSDTLLLECSGASETFGDRASDVAARLIDGLEHGAYGGVEVIRDLASQRGAGRAPSMPVVFASVIGGETKPGVFLERLGWRRVRGAIHTPQVTIDHQVFDTEGRLVANWDTVDERYPDGLIDAMFESYRQVLTVLATDPASWDRKQIVTVPQAAYEVRAKTNATLTNGPQWTLHDLVLHRARLTPESPAIVGPDGGVSYGELVTAALAVSASLRDREVGPGDLVLVDCDRGWRGIAGMLGVLVSGAAYVPLAAGWPNERIKQVAARARARCALSDNSTPRIWPSDVSVIGLTEAMGAEYSAFAPPRPDPESVAYVIFTSGTTGEPKGVVIRHSSVTNTILDLLNRFEVGSEDRVLAISEMTFDLSVFDVFGTLSAGGTVVIPGSSHALDIAALHDLCARENVSIWNSVPAFSVMLVNYRASGERKELPSLRLMMVSGDWVPLNLSGRLTETLPGVELWSLGGATEASIWSCVQAVPYPLPSSWSSVPYGLPLSNQGFRVLDEQLMDRPDWVPGDLYITGGGLADGYINDYETTEAAFFAHPLDGKRMYRTGDRACYWPDGRLEFLGRQDTQVKINGLRVELSEVEAALLREPTIREAVVVVREDKLGNCLVAHVVGDNFDPYQKTRLRNALRERLPGYMVPRSFVFRDRLPLTANGKVDRDSLSRNSLQSRGVPTRASGDTEQRLFEIYSEFVNIQGVTDDFFGAGGNSLTAALLITRIHREFKVRLPLVALYDNRTVRALASRLYQFGDEDAIVSLGGSGTPLVFIHPVGGDVLCYLPVASELAEEFEVYGITRAGSEAHNLTLSELAADYHDRVSRHFGDKNVALVGWSFGASIAYEMAHLAPRSMSVVLLDPWVASHPGGEVRDEELRETFNREIFRGGSGVVDLEDTAYEEFYETYRANARALSEHRFSPHSEVVASIVTADLGFGARPPKHLLPLREVVDTCHLPHAKWYSIDGDHFVIAKPSHAAEVAALIRKGLAR